MKRGELVIAVVLLAAIIVVIIFRDKIDLYTYFESSSEILSEVSEESEESMVIESELSSEAVSEAVSSGETSGSEGENSYLNDAVFIGDSRMQGLQLGTGLTNATFLAERGLSVDKLEDTAIFPLPSGGTGTVYQVLQEQSFGKAYLMFGVNELGWIYPEVFIEDFREIVQQIKALQPNIVIYVNAILPVTASKSSDGDVYTNEKINAWNPMLRQMAEEEGCIFLDAGEVMRDETGALPEEAATDGVHLTAEYCQKWLAYILDHKAVS